MGGGQVLNECLGTSTRRGGTFDRIIWQLQVFLVRDSVPAAKANSLVFRFTTVGVVVRHGRKHAIPVARPGPSFGPGGRVDCGVLQRPVQLERRLANPSSTQRCISSPRGGRPSPGQLTGGCRELTAGRYFCDGPRPTASIGRGKGALRQALTSVGLADRAAERPVRTQVRRSCSPGRPRGRPWPCRR